VQKYFYTTQLSWFSCWVILLWLTLYTSTTLEPYLEPNKVKVTWVLVFFCVHDTAGATCGQYLALSKACCSLMTTDVVVC